MWNGVEEFTFLFSELLRTPEWGQEVQLTAMGTQMLTGFHVLFPVFLGLRRSLESF